MKTSNSMFKKIGMGLLVAASLAACNNNKTAATSTAATPPPAADKEPIVWINTDSLLSKYDYAKDMSKRLTDKESAAKSDLDSKGQAFQREVADYQKVQSTLPADQRQTTEQRLQRKQQELQAYQQNASAQLQNDQADEQNKLFTKISDFAKAYAKEKGYKYILTTSRANTTVLFGEPSLEVTADAIKRLNDAYAKDKK